MLLNLILHVNNYPLIINNKIIQNNKNNVIINNKNNINNDNIKNKIIIIIFIYEYYH